MGKIFVLILFLVCLEFSVAQRELKRKRNLQVCPNVGQDPREISFFGSKSISLLIKKSSPNKLCVLIHVRPGNSTAPMGRLTQQTPGSEYIVTPVARSYLNRKWENVAGPYKDSLTVRYCKKKFCKLKVPKIEPYSTTGSFFLVSSKSEQSFQEELSRFFIQSTFGATKDLINNWAYSEDQAGMAQFLKDQIQLPLTSLRETYRKGADFSLVHNRIGSAAVAPKNPCSQYSRWRDYAFSADYYGQPIKVESFEGKFLVSASDLVFTIVDAFSSTDNSLGGAGDYFFGFRTSGQVGGPILIKGVTGAYKWMSGGNPAIVLNDAAISQDSSIVVINLPDRSNFEDLQSVWTPGLQETPAGGSLRMNVDISGDATSGCDAIANTLDFKRVLGKFPDGTYVWYNGYAELDNNTPESPIVDGGASKKQKGIQYCSNVKRNFLNVDSCKVSKEAACDPATQRIVGNTVVCGSPNEVANDAIAVAKETNTYQFQGVSDSIFFAGYYIQDQAAFYMTKLTAPDQFRQRVAWAFSQLLVVTSNQIDNGNIWTEIFLNYEDIFVRNAFGNYRDILREVSYSPMMGEMLSYISSSSSLYALQREGRISRPDENFAREIMQLFTVGIYKLNIDGTFEMDGGQRIPTYDNTDIQSFARAWTGFGLAGGRSNFEGFRWHQNKIDPMSINGEKRDPFPKMDLNKGYIGDGYPLCNSLPSKQFLRKGARYHAVGNSNKPELTPETSFWKSDGNTFRTTLDQSSQLYQALCNADIDGNCNYQAIVYLEEDLTCTGVECSIDTLQLIKIENSPVLYYEYMPPPCVQLAFSNDAKKVVDQYSRAMCADPDVNDNVFDSCCPASPPASPYWIGKAWSYCEYSGEKVSFSLNEERCNSNGGTVCDAEVMQPNGETSGCGLGIQRWSNSFRWTNQSCKTQVKVGNSGLISIVHDPNFDINIILQENGRNLQSVHQPVSLFNTNFFKINWNEDIFPNSSDECGSCTQVYDGCLCDVEVSEDRVFAKTPSVEEILSELKIGSPHPESYDQNYQLVADFNGVQLYLLPEDEQRFTPRAIFGVMLRGEMKYFFNKQSVVLISNGNHIYSFRNPPSLLSIIEQKTSHAYYETEAVLDHYIHHQNTAPFLATLMIKRFVTSNPSPKYVRRVANAFKDGLYTKHGVDFGDGVHGNLEALFAAVLLDKEARSAVLDHDPSHGSLREPIIKMIAFMRAMEFKRNDRVPTLRMFNMISKIGQEPIATPNVFSFFSPDYANPGAVNDASLTSPESQILTAPNIVGFLNGMMSMVDTGLNTCFGGFGLKSVNNCNQWNRMDPERYARGTLAFTPQGTNATDIVNELTLLLNGGRLSSSSRVAIETAYNEAGNAHKALRIVQKLMLMTPEFHTTSVFKTISEDRPEPVLPDPPTNPYKALVYVNLDGGLDSYNVLVPHSQCTDESGAAKDMFAEYYNVRMPIGVEKGTLFPINVPTGQVCRTFGVHQKLPSVRTLYNDGDLGFFANLGVLQQPVTNKEQFRQLNSKTALFAHNTQQKEINSVDIYDDAAGIGVGGRIADILSLNGYTTGTVSVAGGAPALVSKSTPLLVVNSAGYEKFNPISWETINRNHIEEVNKATRVGSNMFSEIWSEQIFQAMSENDLLFQGMSSASLSNAFQNDGLGRQMGTIAKLIKTRALRNTDRDIFYAREAGFDTHGQVTTGLDILLKQLDDCLNSFSKEMKSQGMWNDVVVVVVSEFGRTLLANTGNGSDHAWGGNYMVLSGSFKGGQVYGEYPRDLTPEGSQIIEDVGITIPSSPWEALWNGVAEWFGVSSENDLKTVLPNREPFENMLWTADDLFN